MPDREKVIKGMQIERECVSRDCDRNCGQCDLVQDRDWLLSVYDDALILLKEQEAVVPVYTTNSHPFHIGILYRCGNCHHSLIRYEDLFCRHCGKPIDWTKKAVKWDE